MGLVAGAAGGGAGSCCEGGLRRLWVGSCCGGQAGVAEVASWLWKWWWLGWLGWPSGCGNSFGWSCGGGGGWGGLVAVEVVAVAGWLVAVVIALAGVAG